MAENKAVITVEINGAERNIKSLKDLKQARKELTEAAVLGDKQAAKSLAELNDRLDDVSDSVKTLKGSGVEKVTNSFGQLGEGLRNFDFDKIKTGFKGIGSAMAAIPIFLIVEGITYLIENFKELSQGNGILAKSLRAVGDVISWVVDKVYALTDALGLTNSELDKQGEAIKKNADDTKEALDRQTAAFDRQIKAAQAAGKSTVELEKAKQQAIIDTNLQVVKQIEAFVRAGGELDDEKKRLLTASLEAIKTAANEQNVIEIKQKQDSIKHSEEAYKRKQELKKKELEDSQKAADELFNELAKQQDIEDSQAAFRKAEKEKALAEEIKLAEYAAKTKAEYEKSAALENEKINAEVNERIKQSNQAVEDAKVKGLQAGQELSQAFFQFQLNAAKGNAAKELEIRKRMFEVDKAFNVARAVQDGIRSVQAAMTIPPPGGQILAVVNGAIAAANVAKILATKFDAGSSGGGGNTVSAPTAAPNIPNLPQVSNTTVPNVQSSTSFDESGKNLNNRVYVVEGDITKAQGRVARLNEQATI